MHARAAKVIDFVRDRGPTHPREIEAAFPKGRVRGAWGNVQSASSHLLDSMHYRGLLRVARRDRGMRVYELAAEVGLEVTEASRATRARALVDLVIAKYAPLPAPSLGYLVQLLRYGAPHLRDELRAQSKEAHSRLPGVTIDGVRWIWPEGERPSATRTAPDDRVRLLAPFDPVVWDRRRFELFWGWTYRFEAYTPVPKRKLGYYALPLLHGDRIIGWGNVSVERGELNADFGYVESKPRSKAFRAALDDELDALRHFLTIAAE